MEFLGQRLNILKYDFHREHMLDHGSLLKISPVASDIIIGKNKSDSILVSNSFLHISLYFFYFNLCALLPELTLSWLCTFCKRMKHIGEPILKALTFKSITLFYSYRDKKLQSRK